MSSPPAPAIELDGVAKRYGDAVVLHETTLLARRGDTIALVGRSGSGKTTLLRMIVGLVEPDRGAVRIGGETMTRASAARLRRAMGYVVQEAGLFPHMTARENVALLAEHLGWDAARVRARVGELREMVELPAPAIERYPAELSGGQRQRVGIMRALMLDPDILLLDEPLGALDPLVRARLRRDLAALFARLGKTVLVVTHDMSEAEALAREIVVVDAGRVVQRGRAEELRANPAAPLVGELVAGDA